MPSSRAGHASPHSIGCKQHFGMRPSLENMSQGGQFSTQILKIIDLAVENENRARFGMHHGSVAAGQV